MLSVSPAGKSKVLPPFFSAAAFLRLAKCGVVVLHPAGAFPVAPCAPKWLGRNMSFGGGLRHGLVLGWKKDGCLLRRARSPFGEKKTARRLFMTGVCQIAVWWRHGVLGCF